MTHLLHLDSSPRGERSHSRRMTKEFVEIKVDNTALVSWLFLFGSLLFMFDAILENIEVISIHSIIHFSASLLFTIASILFLPRNQK